MRRPAIIGLFCTPRALRECRLWGSWRRECDWDQTFLGVLLDFPGSGTRMAPDQLGRNAWPAAIGIVIRRSGLLPKADVPPARWHVRSGPEADIMPKVPSRSALGQQRISWQRESRAPHRSLGGRSPDQHFHCNPSSAYWCGRLSSCAIARTCEMKLLATGLSVRPFRVMTAPRRGAMRRCKGSRAIDQRCSLYSNMDSGTIVRNRPEATKCIRTCIEKQVTLAFGVASPSAVKALSNSEASGL